MFTYLYCFLTGNRVILKTFSLRAVCTVVFRTPRKQPIKMLHFADGINSTFEICPFFQVVHSINHELNIF